MDKSSKDQFIQAYLERQKTYVHSYTSEGLHRPPTSVPHQDVENPSFGFDTPVLLPRVTKLIVSPIANKRRRLSPAKAMQRARKTLDAGILEKENKGSERVSLDTIRCDSSKRKRKKVIISACSDDEREREARLSERRARKRAKRSITKPDANIAAYVSSVSSERENEKVSRKKGKKRSGVDGLALLHGLSATNVGKNRLTLKPLRSFGVFNKGKASTKVRVCNAKKPGETLFSELAFLGGETKPESLVDESVVRDSSSQLPSASAKKSKATNYRRKGKKSTCSTSRHSSTSDLRRGTPVMSETWDIELQSKCPSLDRFSSQSDRHDPGSLILDPRKASWHDHEPPSKGHAMHSVTPVKDAPRDRSIEGIVSPGPPSAVATIFDVSSIHPSHSASQIGLRQVDRPKSPEEFLTSRYFDLHANNDVRRVPPKLDQPQPVECQDVVRHYADNSSGTMSNRNSGDAYPFPHYASAMHLPVISDSSPLRIHGISQEQYLPLTDDVAPDHRIFSATQPSRLTRHDRLTSYDPDEYFIGLFERDMDSSCHDFQDHGLEFLAPPDFSNDPTFCSPVQAYFSDGSHHSSEMDMVVPDKAPEGASQPFGYVHDASHCEHSDITLEQYQRSFASASRPITDEAYGDPSCSPRPFLQGRAMLLGISPCVPMHDVDQVNVGNGLLSAEVDVAKRLKDHWRPHRL